MSENTLWAVIAVMFFLALACPRCSGPDFHRQPAHGGYTHHR